MLIFWYNCSKSALKCNLNMLTLSFETEVFSGTIVIIQSTSVCTYLISNLNLNGNKLDTGTWEFEPQEKHNK